MQARHISKLAGPQQSPGSSFAHPHTGGAQPSAKPRPASPAWHAHLSCLGAPRPGPTAGPLPCTQLAAARLAPPDAAEQLLQASAGEAAESPRKAQAFGPRPGRGRRAGARSRGGPCTRRRHSSGRGLVHVGSCSRSTSGPYGPDPQPPTGHLQLDTADGSGHFQISGDDGQSLGPALPMPREPRYWYRLCPSGTGSRKLGGGIKVGRPFADSRLLHHRRSTAAKKNPTASK